MWFSSIKETAKNVWNASKQMIDKRSPAEKLIDEITTEQSQIIPTLKLTQLANMTYDAQTFDEIINIFVERLRVFQYSTQKSAQTLNILVATNYLIKHGATAFVDEFRSYLDVFQKYQTLKKVVSYESEVEQAKLDYTLQKIKSRAYHIQILLQDKQKLLKEKQLSMLVKQKLKLYEKGKLSELKNISGENKEQNKRKAEIMNSEDITSKLEGIMERYLWKYVDKLDDTIEMASEKIMEQIDKYIIGEEMPEKFQLEDEEEGEKQNEEKKKKKQEEDELMKKLEEEGNNLEEQPHMNTDLLEFEEVIEEKTEKKAEESLI